MISIRRAARSDAANLATLYRHFADKQPSYFERCIDEGFTIFVASAAGKDVGFGIVNFASRYQPFRRMGIPEIQDLNVIPALRGQGIATAIIGACENEARNDGREQIGLAVGLGQSYGPAQRLYVKMGYMPDGAGAMYDHQTPEAVRSYPLDDDFCLMLVKAL